MAKKNPEPTPTKAELIQQLIAQNAALLSELQKDTEPSSRIQATDPLVEKLRVGIRTYGLHVTVLSFERTYGSAYDVELKDARGNLFKWRSTSRDVILEAGQRLVMDIRPKKINGNLIEVGYGKIRKDGDTSRPRRAKAKGLRG